MATASESNTVPATPFNLSNLSKGIGELLPSDRKVEVVLDDQVSFRLIRPSFFNL